MTALKVENLWKSYGANEVLKGVSFEVLKGEIFAVLGVNGAGKTTLFECIEGLKRFEKGAVEIMGRPQAEALSLTGVQLQSGTLPEKIRVGEALRLFSAWNGRSGTDGGNEYRFGLEEVKNKLYGELSTGWKRRLHLALAVASSPEIVFLDEPTAGLDVEARASLHGEIRAMKEAGKTVVLASHDMAEVESLCDRLIMLTGGVAAFCGTVGEFTALDKGNFKIHIKLAGQSGYSLHEASALGDGLSAILESVKARGETVEDIKIDRPTLEDSFLSVAGMKSVSSKGVANGQAAIDAAAAQKPGGTTQANTDGGR